jgi:FAD/FMN-containing dehydrogenase
MIDPADLAAFRDILGAEGIATAPDERLPYETAARYGKGVAAAVLRPANTAQVSAVLSYCARRRLPYMPQSGNTGLVLGSTPDPSGTQLVVSLQRLRELRVDVFDRTVTVGAGVRLSALNAALEPHELHLPIDVSSDPMIGGMVATNTGGARFLRYGDMRRHVLSLEVVLADDEGTVLQLARGLRKDNTQLDLRDLFVGSCGALGAVTCATLEVHPRPKQVATALLVPRDTDSILDLMAGFENLAGDYLSAFEGMSGSALRHVFRYAPGLRNPFGTEPPAYAILVELSSMRAAHRQGEPALQTTLEEITASIASQAAAPLTDAVFGAPEQFWRIRHSLSDGLRSQGEVVGLDLSFRRTQVLPFRNSAIRMLHEEFPEYEVCDFGHIADGGLHFNLLCSSGTGRAAEVRKRVTQLAVEQFGASFSGEHGIGRANQADYSRYTPSQIKRFSAEVIKVFSTLPSAAIDFGP